MNNLVVESFYSHRESDVIQMNTNSIQMSLDGLNSGHNKPFKRTSSYRPYKFPQKSIEYEGNVIVGRGALCAAVP